jgi:hypothetical protein
MRVLILLASLALGTIATVGTTSEARAQELGDRADTLAREFMSPF